MPAIALSPWTAGPGIDITDEDGGRALPDRRGHGLLGSDAASFVIRQALEVESGLNRPMSPPTPTAAPVGRDHSGCDAADA